MLRPLLVHLHFLFFCRAWQGEDLRGITGGVVGIPKEVVENLLFDSVGDHRGIVSSASGTRARIGIWQVLLPNYTLEEQTEMYMSWMSPSDVWNGLMPETMRKDLEETVQSACRDHCGAEPVESCCGVQVRCRRVHEMLYDVASRGKKAIENYWTKYSDLSSRIMDRRWVFALPSVMPKILAGAKATDDVVMFFVFVWSRYSSNPILQQCLSSRWGRLLRQKHLNLLTSWRELRRMLENFFWEVVATGRFRDFRWAQAGMQLDVPHSLWQKMGDVMFECRVGFEYLERAAQSHGWATHFEEDRTLEQLAAAKDGEYPGLLLARAEFHDSWFLDKPVLRFLIRHVLVADESLGEFGAFGGRYSDWLNDTGLVEAFAFDGIPEAPEITGGRVSHLQLGDVFDLGRTFDWVMCLEVGEHMPPGSEDTLMSNIARHATKGAIISWATPDYPSPYHPNTLTLEASTALIERHGFKQDQRLTEMLRDAAETSWLKQTIGVYHRMV